MSKENVEIVKANYEAFASRGLDGWMEQFADDVEYRAPEGSLDDVGPIHGKTALRAWLQQWMDTFEGFWFEAVEFIDAGEDQVVVVERFGGAPRSAASKRNRPKRWSPRFATERSRGAANS